MDMKKVLSLTLKEIDEAAKMRDAVLQEAIAAEELIRTTYSFENMKEERIVVWTDGRNTDHITRDGVWHADYLNRDYKVTCTVEGIFEVLKVDYFMISSLPAELKENAMLCSYFKWFLDKTKAWKEKENK